MVSVEFGEEEGCTVGELELITGVDVDVALDFLEVEKWLRELFERSEVLSFHFEDFETCCSEEFVKRCGRVDRLLVFDATSKDREALIG
jgi:hypothetical protein